MAENISTTTESVSFDEIAAEFDLPTGEESISLLGEKKEEDPFKSAPVIPKAGNRTEGEEGTNEEKDDVSHETVVFDKLVKETLEDQDGPEKKLEDNPAPSATIAVLKKLIEDEELVPFDDDKAIEDYTEEDIRDLLLENKKHDRTQVKETIVKEVFESLPREMQYAMEYISNGGTDLKTLFKALAATEEVKDFDPETSRGQDQIITTYYQTLEWTPEEIEEELEKLNELGAEAKKKKAAMFQPKLAKMQEDVTNSYVERQREANTAREAEFQGFMDEALKTIQTGKLGKIALEPKIQAALYQGLTQANFRTRSGKATNELWHLLEKKQFIEKDMETLYEVLWLLRDKKGYDEAKGKVLESEEAGKTVRTLKTEQGKSKSGTSQQADPDNKRTKKTISRTTTPSFLSGLK